MLNPVSAPFVPAPWRAFNVSNAGRSGMDALRELLLGSPLDVHGYLRDVRLTDALRPEWTTPKLRRPFDRFRPTGDGYAPTSLSLETSTVGQLFLFLFFLDLHFYLYSF